MRVLEMFDDPVVKRVGHGHWVLSIPVLFSKHLREYSWGELRLFAFNFSNFFFPVDILRRSC